MSFIGQQTNQQTLNGIIDLTDGTISIVDGDISNVKSLSLNGDINMNTHKISNLDDGVAAGDAVNKSQLDAISLNLADYVKRDGSNPMEGNLNLNFHKIIGVALGYDPDDAVNKYQLDFKADLSYVDSSLNTLKNYVNTQSVNSNYLLRNGTRMT